MSILSTLRSAFSASPVPVPAAGAHKLSYDATEGKGKRKAPTGVLLDADSELPPAKRRKLQSAGRDAHRNFSVARWMIGKHLDYVATFTFQARTPNKEFNAFLETKMQRWSHQRNCDGARRHPLRRIVRMAEARRTVDGDMGLVPIANGTLQGLEGDRIRNPIGALPPGIDPARLIHGVYVGSAGEALGYAVNTRTCGGGFKFERMVPAKNLFLFGYFDRFDQVRGISPLAPALNTLRDTYEGCDYALGKMKVAQLFGLVLTRRAAESLGSLTESDDEGEDAGSAIDLTGGPLQLDLDIGEDAKFIDSHSPSTEFQSFTEAMIGLSLKALDIPYSFYDESYTNYSGARQALLQYEQACNNKRADIGDLLDEITDWRIRLWFDDGEITGFSPEDIVWEWIPTGIPWIDPLKEVQADIAAINAGLTSRQRRLKERGEDFWQITDELAAEEAYRKEKGLTTEIAPAANIQIVEHHGNAKDDA